MGLVLAAASPLRDRSNEVETFKTPGKHRSRGGEERRRLSRDLEELEDGRRPAFESEMMSFDEMRKQLSMWQTHLCELAAEQKEAEKLRQDTSSLRSKLSSSEAEASDRARRLVETRVQVQDKVRELADTHEQLNKKFIELAKEREVSDMLRRENGQMSVSVKEAERQFVAAQAEVASLKAEMTADKVQLTRVQARNTELEADSDQLRVRSHELEEELAQVSQASTEAARRLQVQEGKIEDLRSQCEMHQAEVHQAREECESLAREAEVGLRAQKQMTALEQELETKRELALSMETELEKERRKRQLYEAVQVEKLALETEVADLRGALEREQNLSQTQKDELLNLRGQASMQQLQLKETAAAAAEAEQSCSELKTQHEAEVGSLRAQLHEVKASAEQQRYEAVQELQNQSIEVQRLLSVESTLQAALDGHCQQLAVRAQEQKDTQEQLLKLQQAHSQSLARQEEMEGERQTEAESHEAQEASLAALKLEIAEASSTLEAAQQETLLWKQRAEILLGRRKAAMAVASRWHGADAAWDWLMEQGQGPQELQDLPEGTELRLQNRELCLSLRQFKQDCESLEAENLSLKEALACMEDDLHRVSDQHAQLVGHVNHRQKIRYTMKLKEEINRLHGDLKKARQRIVQLEVNKESDSLFEALASVVGGESYTTASKARRGSRLATSQRRGSVAATRPPRRGEVVSREDDQVRLAEAEQLCMLQQSALDRISMDFQHLKALIERAVQLADAERRHGVEGGNFAALLHRLREIIAANHRNPSSGGNTDDLGRLPVTATSITCDDDDEELAEGDTVCYGCPEQQDHAVEELG